LHAKNDNKISSAKENTPINELDFLCWFFYHEIIHISFVDFFMVIRYNTYRSDTMILQYFVTEEASGKTIPIEIDRATTADLATTKSCWQSDWTSDFIGDPNLEKYAAKTDEGEIVALGAYKEDENGISIYIVDIEAHPESNPTISQPKKYLGIGRMMIAFGIQLSIDASLGGIVTFAAKTDELLEHYIKDFGAIPIAQPMSGGPKLLMIADESAQEIFSTYLS